MGSSLESLVDENELGRPHRRLQIAPSRTRGHHIRLALLGGAERLFLSVSLHDLRKRSTAERLTWMRVLCKRILQFLERYVRVRRNLSANPRLVVSQGVALPPAARATVSAWP